MGVFRLKPEGVDAEALELDLIDHGLEEMGEGVSDKGEPQLVVRCAFTDFGRMQKALEDRKLTPISAEAEYIPSAPASLAEPAATEVLKLVDTLEQDEDVQKVFHNLA
jgi:transcriptional/translational regulatory protein YebC/TACO1